MDLLKAFDIALLMSKGWINLAVLGPNSLEMVMILV